MNQEILKRRTFAIISHPDAGKTTLTEKFLLYGGALQMAGSVTARKQQREAASDWMELEKKRGISISSTLLQFDYGPWKMNLLDTPGHKDFSEDTYRVLMAVDAVVMVIDAGKSIETQTRKLFEICRRRHIPIFTFMNKLDRPSLPPLQLLDDLENVLGINAYPVNWPLGDGKEFKGVYSRPEKQVHFFERVPGGAYKAPVTLHNFADPTVRETLEDTLYSRVAEELEILDAVHPQFEIDSVLKGETSLVFFGSAGNNFGVQLLLDNFAKYSSPPTPRHAGKGLIAVNDKSFSGFVFKIQTNMDPLHRDRIAFVRVCSGKFVRDMYAHHHRSGKEIRLSGSHMLFGQNREVVDEAYPGDIIGFVAKPDLRIGDTISEDTSIVYHEIPRFAPECFAYLNNPTPSQYKAFRKGIDHLLAEDIVQGFQLKNSLQRTVPLLGAVGPLQFEVLQYRLKSEYGAESQMEVLPWKMLRWVNSDLSDDDLEKSVVYDGALGEDDLGRRVILFKSDWAMQRYQTENPKVQLLDSPAAV